MKKISILITILIISTVSVFAQDWNGEKQTSQQRAENFVNNMNEKIPLRKPQKDSLITVCKTFYDDMQTYRTEGNMEVVKALAQKRDNNVKQILSNDEKYAAYITFLADLKAQREQRMKDGGGQGGRGGQRSGGGF